PDSPVFQHNIGITRNRGLAGTSGQLKALLLDSDLDLVVRHLVQQFDEGFSMHRPLNPGKTRFVLTRDLVMVGEYLAIFEREAMALFKLSFNRQSRGNRFELVQQSFTRYPDHVSYPSFSCASETSCRVRSSVSRSRNTS